MTKPKSQTDPFALRKRPLIVLSVDHDERQLRGILEQAEQFEWDLLDLQFCGGAIPSTIKPDGAIVKEWPTDPLVRDLVARECPTIRIGKLAHSGDRQVPAVLTDLAAIGRMAAEHFAERGFRSLAYIGHDPWSHAQAVYDAFSARAEEIGFTCNLLRLQSRRYGPMVTKTEIYEERSKLIGNWLRELPKPVGVLGYHDRMAGTLTAMCAEAGLAVPEDVAVLGIGNAAYNCQAAPVPISSIDPFPEEHGRQAALLLHRLLQGEPAPESPILIEPKEIVERRSTEVIAVSVPEVAEALRFMWDRLDMQLNVDDIANYVGVSRRKLERAFRQQLNRGVNAEMRRKRLERCRELLRSTDMTVAEIAFAIGLNSRDYLHQAFRRAYGMTPNQYREQNNPSRMAEAADA